MSYNQIDNKLKQLQAKYKQEQKKFSNELGLFFDEFNLLNTNNKYKKKLKKRYEKYKSDNELVTLYIAYLLSLPLTETILLELGITERVDTLYNAYKKINISAEREFKQLGYQDCLKDIGEKQAKRQFKTKQDEEYINNKIIQDAQRIKKEAQTGLNKKELKVNDSLLDRMNNEWLRINKGKYSGYMERLAELGYNYGYVKCCIDYGIKQVQFVAVEDNKTTHMCDSLAGQVFNIKGKNEFYRYYASSNKVEQTTTIGLVQGINMPPIDDSFHWCRSYLQAVKVNKQKD